ncbi:MAG: hypothetical protein KatS3mg002_1652 [Candidatus Woesearchaeota archaeon]|nr:MAG: hypothetical protein KatS3mg002_1652 [Candidatus Woesearchaeota archaeon]
MKNKYKVATIAIFLLSCTSNNNQITTSSPIPKTVTQSTSAQPTSIQSPSNNVPTPSIIPTQSPNSLTNNLTTDISSNATLTGKVYNQNGIPLDNATVTIEYENKKFETKTIGGAYVFRNIPTGIPILVTASKGDDYPSKTQSIVLKSNLLGNTNLNNLNFGDEFSEDSINKKNFFFLTDTPEIIEVYLNNTNNYTTIHYNFSIKFVFNKLVQKKSVFENFYMRSLNNRVDANVLIGDGTGITSNTDNADYKCIINRYTPGLIFDWDTRDSDEYGKELKVTFTKNAGLVTSIDKNIFYGVTFRGNTGSTLILSKDNKAPLESGDFYVNNQRRKNFIFTVLSDKAEPELSKIELGNDNGKKQIRLFFSEPMTFIGANSFNNDILDINNYIFYKNGDVFSPISPILRMIDATILEIEMDNSSFSDRDTIKVEVKPNVKDPAGNFFSRGQKNGEWNYIKSDTL